MSFNSDAQKPISNKIVLFELDIPQKSGEADVLLNYESAIWFVRLAPGVVTVTDDHGVTGYFQNTTVDDGLDIGSVIVRDVNYIRVASIEELRIQRRAFYYDNSTTDLYIHFELSRKPLNFRWLDYLNIGAVTGYCNAVDDQREDRNIYDNIEYLPRLRSVPSLKKKKDKLFFGLVSFGGGNVEFDNTDGFFDSFRDLNIYRQACRVYVGFGGYERQEFKQVFQGFVDNYNWDFGKFVVKLADPRKALSNPLPIHRLTKTDWPTLGDGEEDEYKPIIYGYVRGAKAIPLNEDGDNNLFLIADTYWHNLTEVHNVYVDGTLLSEENWSVTLSEGTLSIPSFSSGDVTVDVTGADVHNAGLVVQDLLQKYSGIEFIDSNFNRPEFNRVKSTARTVGLYIDDTSKVIDQIEKCCVANDMIFLVQDDGRLSMRTYVENRVPAATVYSDEQMTFPSVKINEGEFLSEVLIKYNKHHEDDKWYKYKNDSYIEEVVSRYNAEQSDSFETVLVNRADAEAKSEMIMTFSKRITEQVKMTTKFQHVEREIMDFIVSQPLKRKYGSDRWAVYEVIGIDKDLNKFEVKFDWQFVRWFTPEPEADFQNGVLWNEYLWNDKIYQIREEL